MPTHIQRPSPRSRGSAKAKAAPANDAAKAGRFHWAAEIDYILTHTDKPLTSSQIADAILDRHPDHHAPNAKPIVRVNLARRCVKMDWVRVGDAWAKKKVGAS